MKRARHGRLAKMTRADRQRRQEHNERTNRKGKQWVAHHVVKEVVYTPKDPHLRAQEKREREDRKLRDRLKKLGVELVEKPS